LREKDVFNNNYMYLSSSTIASFKKTKKKNKCGLNRRKCSQDAIKTPNEIFSLGTILMA
jgi:hypothetical protein